MQAVVDQVLDGKYDYENSSLDFSCAKVELSMRKGEICEGSFHVYSSRTCFTQGYVSATDIRMECITSEFTGNGEEIFYCFHGEHLEEGDVVKGNFCIVSNQGEYYLPFVVTVVHQAPESSVGNVKNLFHFANLAKSNWREAVELFYTPEFKTLFEGSDRQYYDCYRGLSYQPGNEQNVEEFLIRINKKQKTEFLVRETEIYREIATASYDVIENELNIVKNGWGYTALQIECEGDFLFTEKEFLGEDDFLGNRYTLPLFVDPQMCREGKNFGRVYLYNSYVSITIPVTVRMGEKSAERRGYLQKKREIVQMMECYLDFRMKKINSAAWMEKTGVLVDAMLARDEADVAARLFQAQLLISEERYNEAQWTLNHAMDIMEETERDDTLYAYYLYLTTLMERKEDYVVKITEKVERLYARDRSNWRIAWLLLYLSEEYNKTAATKWDFLERQFKQGCYSPVFYIEGLHLLNTNPTLLRKLDDYALQLLHFGARRGGLSPEISGQILYLAGRVKEFSPVLLKILQTIYERIHDEHTLQEICTLLVRGNKVGRKYFAWYEAGVEAQLRITNLYEYYMMSLDFEEQKKLPRIVLMYFAYQNNLDLTHSAYLYWYVEQHKSELGEFYDIYKPRMEHFVVDQIQKERINRHLAYLYQKLLTPAMIDQQNAQALARLLFAHYISVDDLRLKRVIVYQPGNLRESSYPLQNGHTWVPLYGNDCAILFEDAYGNRFAKSVEYTLEKLMIPGRFLKQVSALVQDCVALDLYLEESRQAFEEITSEDLERMNRLIANDQVEERIRRKLYLRILRYYFDTDNDKALDECLRVIPMEIFTLDERAEILRYIVLRGAGEDCWDWVREYGPYFVEPKTLVHLIDERIDQVGEENTELMQVALYAFRQGKYDSKIVQYLEAYADCPTKELRDIWKAARSFEMDAYHVSERILLQMLYSGAFVGEKMEIFSYYVSRGADPRIEEAFLARCAYDYFVKDQLTDEIVFQEIYKMADRQDEVLRVCKLAFLKYYAENLEDITQEIIPVIEDFLHEMLVEKIHLNFFKNYIGKSFIKDPLLLELMDKTIVEYCARPGSRATIHYVIMHEDGEASEYLTETMREVFGGICFKEFVLFFGESLQYYIMEEKDGEEQLTVSGNLQKSDIHGKDGDWRYEMINDILISCTLEDFDTLDGLLDEYHRREYLGENLFALQ